MRLMPRLPACQSLDSVNLEDTRTPRPPPDPCPTPQIFRYAATEEAPWMIMRHPLPA